jgi:hypothetical protein
MGAREKSHPLMKDPEHKSLSTMSVPRARAAREAGAM